MGFLVRKSGVDICAARDAGERAALEASGRIPDGAEIVIVVTPEDVRAEYQRRLILLLGAGSLAHAGFIRADDADETAALQALASPTPEQAARLAELIARRNAVTGLIDRYNALDAMSPIPADYASDERWQ